MERRKEGGDTSSTRPACGRWSWSTREVSRAPPGAADLAHDQRERAANDKARGCRQIMRRVPAETYGSAKSSPTLAVAAAAHPWAAGPGGSEHVDRSDHPTLNPPQKSLVSPGRGRGQGRGPRMDRQERRDDGAGGPPRRRGDPVGRRPRPRPERRYGRFFPMSCVGINPALSFGFLPLGLILCPQKTGKSHHEVT